MYGEVLAIQEDPTGITKLMREAVELVPQVLPDLKIQVFWRQSREFVTLYPQFRAVPRSLIDGLFKWGMPRTWGCKSIIWRGNGFRVRGVGDVALACPRKICKEPRYYEFDLSEGTVTPFFFGRPRASKFDPTKNIEGETLTEQRRGDRNLDFIMVNEGFHGSVTYKKKNVLDYVRDNPYVTKKELSRMGFRSDMNMDLLTDSVYGMQDWLRSRTKPKDCNVLSNSQIGSREERELRMPDALSDSDSTSGRLANQSYDQQIFRSLHDTSSYDFLS